MRTLVPALAVVVLALAPAAAAADRSAPEPLRQRIERITDELRCPVCQNLSVWDSPSPVAHGMRLRVRDLVRRGASDAEIRAYFVGRYGEWVLLRPPRRGIAMSVWLAPAVLLGAGALAVAAVVARWRRRARALSAASPERIAAGEALLGQSERGRRELARLSAELREGELTPSDYALLRRRLAAEVATEEEEAQPVPARRPAAAGARSRASGRWIAGLAAGTLAATVLVVPALRERMPGMSPTGNDFTMPPPAAQPPELTAERFAELIRRADELARRGRVQEAVPIYRMAVAVAPRRADFRTRLGFALARTGSARAGLVQLRRAVRADPRFADARLYLAAVLLGTGDRESARRQLRLYLELAPSGAGARLARRLLAS